MTKYIDKYDIYLTINFYEMDLSEYHNEPDTLPIVNSYVVNPLSDEFIWQT